MGTGTDCESDAVGEATGEVNTVGGAEVGSGTGSGEPSPTGAGAQAVRANTVAVSHRHGVILLRPAMPQACHGPERNGPRAPICVCAGACVEYSTLRGDPDAHKAAEPGAPTTYYDSG
ncbi:hypothetical protein GCM10028820_34070 [Tessaracoccus terricola]